MGCGGSKAADIDESSITIKRRPTEQAAVVKVNDSVQLEVIIIMQYVVHAVTTNDRNLIIIRNLWINQLQLKQKFMLYKILVNQLLLIFHLMIIMVLEIEKYHIHRGLKYFLLIFVLETSFIARNSVLLHHYLQRNS